MQLFSGVGDGAVVIGLVASAWVAGVDVLIRYFMSVDMGRGSCIRVRYD